MLQSIAIGKIVYRTPDGDMIEASNSRINTGGVLMKVSRMILGARIHRLREELAQIDREIGQNGFTDSDIKELRVFVHVKLDEAELLMHSLEHTESHVTDGGTLARYADELHRIRKDVTTAVMRWRRICSRNSRGNKPKRKYVPLGMAAFKELETAEEPASYFRPHWPNKTA